MDKVPVSAVIITKNEESNIEDCLKSLYGWVDEIILVDDESTDHTVRIAEKYADKIFHRKMVDEGSHRNWAYAQAKNDWVFSIDADETATPELRDEIREVIKDTDVIAFSIPRRNYIGDYWVKFGGQYPAPQLRLFLKDRLRYEEVQVHPRVFAKGKKAVLTKDVIHKSYKSFEHFLAKLNGQTTLEAKKWIMTNRHMSMKHAFWRSWDRFWRMFLMKKGYKDGFYGFMFAYFASLYQIMSYAKYWEMKRAQEKKQG